MNRDFILPDLGEGIHEAQVVNVMVKEGDSVTEDQMVMEVETDKASVELPVPFAGVVTKVNVAVGQTIKVGQVLLTVEATSGPSEAAGAGASAAGGAEAAVSAPEAGVSPEVPALPPPPEYGPGPVPAAPAVRRFARELGVDLRQVRGSGPGGRILRGDVERYQQAVAAGRGGPTPTAPPKAVPAQAAPAAVRSTAGPAPAPTAAPVPAVSSGVTVPGVPPAPIPAGVVQAAAVEALPDFTQWGPVRREQVPQIRKTIARQMARAWAVIPHVCHMDEADVTDLEKFRKEQGEVFTNLGAKLTLTAFIIKAVTGALQQFPKLNASFDEAAAEIIFKDYYNIGIAVDTPRGLIVPVLRNAERKGLMAVSKEMKDLADRVRGFKLDISEMCGGTFTITNVGALGGIMATPVINWPEVAILGLGRMTDKPVVRGGAIVVRRMLPLFLSFDHRIIDGADGARFVNAIITFLENPLNLLLV
ncbi:MAG TPA: dihydrolipoamide acetyltransferase family protein [Phycisphaerae bacterium]|nr:dihydrolipoamide acetyltransferase family protein [Phycisphaerae bacterium]